MELGNYCGVGWEPNRSEFRVEWADAACCGGEPGLRWGSGWVVFCGSCELVPL
jgi:hypothetical protein